MRRGGASRRSFAALLPTPRASRAFIDKALAGRIATGLFDQLTEQRDRMSLRFRALRLDELMLPMVRAAQLIAVVLLLAFSLLFTSCDRSPKRHPAALESHRGRVLWAATFENDARGLYSPEDRGIYSNIRKEGSGLNGTATITTERARTGMHSLKIFLPAATSGGTVGRFQLVANMPLGKPGDDRWYGISVYVGKDWDLHQIVDGRQYFLAGLMGFRYADTLANGPGGNIGARVIAGVPHFASSTILPHEREIGIIVGSRITKGRWFDFVEHVKWSYGSDGVRELWENGVKVGVYHGQTLHIKSRFELRAGLYEGTRVSNNRTIYIDNQRVGTSYAAVDPSR
jgi:Polysaccharide lyase